MFLETTSIVFCSSTVGLNPTISSVGETAHGQLAIVPGTSHGLPLEKPALTADLILGFLADEQVTKLTPTRDRA